MADMQNGVFQCAGDGTPGNVSQSGQPDQQPDAQGQHSDNTPQYITRDDVVALVTDLMSRAENRITDRTTARVKKVLDQASANGLNMTREQAEAVLKVIDTESASSQNPAAASQGTPNQGQPAGSQAPQSGELHPVILTAIGMMKKAGVDVEEGDPEYSLIDKATTDEDVFLASVRQAINTKKARVAQAGSPARMPNLASGGAAGAGGSKAALVAELQQILYSNDGPKDMARVRELKEQLAKYK